MPAKEWVGISPICGRGFRCEDPGFSSRLKPLPQFPGCRMSQGVMMVKALLTSSTGFWCSEIMPLP